MHVGYDSRSIPLAPKGVRMGVGLYITMVGLPGRDGDVIKRDTEGELRV